MPTLDDLTWNYPVLAQVSILVGLEAKSILKFCLKIIIVKKSYSTVGVRWIFVVKVITKHTICNIQLML